MASDNILAQVIERLTKKRPRGTTIAEAPKGPRTMDFRFGRDDQNNAGETTLESESGHTMEGAQGAERVPTNTFRPEKPSNVLKQKIDELMNRDYSKKRGENGEVVYGKDYDQTRNLKDIFRSMGLGALTSVANAKLDYSPGANPLAQLLGASIGGAGGGGIAGAVDRNYDNKLQDQLKIAKMVPMYEQQQKMEDAELARRGKEAQIINLEQQPEYKTREARRKEAKDERDYEIKTRTLDWKKEDRDRYYELEGIKIDAKEKGDKRTYDLAVKRQQELERHNKQTEKQADINEQGRNKRSAMTQQGMARRQQIDIEAKRTLEEYKQAQANGRAEAANALRQKLADLKKERDGLEAPNFE